MAILQDMSTLQAQVDKLLAENAVLKAAKGRLSMKVTEKGGVSVYGMGRYPVSLYRGQWERLIEAMPQIKAFIEANVDRLAVKGEG